MLWRCGDAKPGAVAAISSPPALPGPRADRHQRPGAGAAEGHPVRVSGGTRAPGAARLVVLRHAGLRHSGRQRSIALGCLLADCAAGDLSLTLAIAREMAIR